MFGAMGSAGLAEVLRGTSSLDNAIVHMVDPTVDVLTAGSSASAAPELFESRTFTQMLDEMPEFDEDMMQQRLMNMPREQLMALVSRMTREQEMRR